MVDSNFEILKKLLRALVGVEALTATEYKIINYQLDQEFNFIRNGKVKNGDSRGYMKKAKDLGIARQSVIRATKNLEQRSILIVERNQTKFGDKYVNRYHINRDIDSWG